MRWQVCIQCDPERPDVWLTVADCESPEIAGAIVTALCAGNRGTGKPILVRPVYL